MVDTSKNVWYTVVYGLGEKWDVHACRSQRILMKNTDNTELLIAVGRITLLHTIELQIRGSSGSRCKAGRSFYQWRGIFYTDREDSSSNLGLGKFFSPTGIVSTHGKLRITAMHCSAPNSALDNKKQCLATNFIVWQRPFQAKELAFLHRATGENASGNPPHLRRRKKM